MKTACQECHGTGRVPDPDYPGSTIVCVCRVPLLLSSTTAEAFDLIRNLPRRNDDERADE